MRKRRRLADKFTIMVCAVLVAVSAFFYAPMEVSANERSVSGVVSSGNVTAGGYKAFDLLSDIPNINLYSDGVNDKLYEVNYTVLGDLNFSTDVFVRHLALKYGSLVLYDALYIEDDPNNHTTHHVFNYSDKFYVLGSSLKNNSLYFNCLLYATNSAVSSINFSNTFDVMIDSIVEVSSEGSDDYQNGYNAGYSAGEQAGYGNGYSQGFADGESSVDTNEIYNQGFNDGKESVDTQSYYDAGYQAGYQVAYSEGYDSGYDEGYQSAMDRIDGWGADTTDYPVLVNELNTGSISRWAAVLSAVPSDCLINYWVNFDNNYNPNHTYKFSLQFSDFYMQRNSYQDYVYSSDVTLSCNVGGILYPLRGDSSSFDVFYVPGNRISDTLEIVWTMHNACIDPTDDCGEVGFKFSDLNIKIYDLGPSGDTQNHIANQTDSLTNGFNDSHGNSVNNEFSSGLNDFETAEDSLFATATTGLKDFTFFDIQSVPAMVTGMSFVGSIMSGWFTQAGGASGVGIVLSILFSIMLVAMVLGLYRWYQSKGGKD